MNMKTSVETEPSPNFVSPVCTQVAKNNTNGHCTGNFIVKVAEKRQELLVTVPFMVFVYDVSIQNVECDEQIHLAIAPVIVQSPSGLVPSDRNYRLCKFESLHPRLLIHAEYYRLLKWIHAQANHIYEFLLKMPVTAELERACPEQLQAMLIPDALDSHVAHAEMAGE